MRGKEKKKDFCLGSTQKDFPISFPVQSPSWSVKYLHGSGFYRSLLLLVANSPFQPSSLRWLLSLLGLSLIKHHPLPFSSLQKLYHLQQDKYWRNILSVPAKEHPLPKPCSILTRLNPITEMPWSHEQRCSCSSLQHVFPQRCWAGYRLSLAPATTFS